MSVQCNALYGRRGVAARTMHSCTQGGVLDNKSRVPRLIILCLNKMQVLISKFQEKHGKSRVYHPTLRYLYGKIRRFIVLIEEYVD